jgi:hypothetical protein
MTEGGRELAIVPVEQRTINFYGDDLVAVRDEAGTVWVPVRRLCEALGIDWSGQRQRILRDPVMADELQSVGVTPTNSRRGRGDPEALALPLKFVRAWLFGVNATRVKPELREKLIAYQREVIEIIDRAFSPPPTVSDTGEAEIIAMRDLAQQQAELALQQARLWDRMLAERRRLDAVQELAEDHESTIRDLELRIDTLAFELRQVQAELSRRLTAGTDHIRLLPAGEAQRIAPEQKAAIKALVDDLVAAAQAKGVRLGQGRNDYPAVWDAFKRRFDLAKYDELPASRFDEALTWLKGWKDRL